MGREVRMVPLGWQHPQQFSEYRHEMMYKPLLSREQWDLFHEEPVAPDEANFIDNRDNYMLLDVPKEQCTQYMMYETCSEGTPISPAFDTPEELARWLADNNGNAFAGDTATYEEWLSMILDEEETISMVMVEDRMVNGVTWAATSKEQGNN